MRESVDLSSPPDIVFHDVIEFVRKHQRSPGRKCFIVAWPLRRDIHGRIGRFERLERCRITRPFNDRDHGLNVVEHRPWSRSVYILQDERIIASFFLGRVQKYRQKVALRAEAVLGRTLVYQFPGQLTRVLEIPVTGERIDVHKGERHKAGIDLHAAGRDNEGVLTPSDQAQKLPVVFQ